MIGIFSKSESYWKNELLDLLLAFNYDLTSDLKSKINLIYDTVCWRKNEKEKSEALFPKEASTSNSENGESINGLSPPNENFLYETLSGFDQSDISEYCAICFDYYEGIQSNLYMSYLNINL